MPAARRARAAPARAQRKPTTEKESTARDDVDAKPDDDVAVKRERRAADADAVASDDESTRATKRTKSSETGTGTVGGGGDACDDDFKTLVRIDNNAGRVIGKGGENVKYIENTCGCVVEFRRDARVAV
jgi:far upstream element-binding protein